MTFSPREADVVRTRFLNRIGPDSAFYRLFDLLPEIAFFAKDCHFRLMCASQRFVESCGCRTEAEVIGRDDFELFPAHLAESFRRDDEEVMRRGQPKRHIVEVFFNDQGLPDWFVTNKLPIRDRRGQVIGVMGTVQSYEARRAIMRPSLEIDRVVAYIREHFRRGVQVKELPEVARLSPRQLHRRFVEAFGMSPQRFIVKLRMQAACEALQRGEMRIAEVARELGFCDQSAFTQIFVKHVGATPLKYQRRFRLGARE